MARQRLLYVARALLAASCGTASAQMAFTTQHLYVFAGPGTGYPLVAQLVPGATLQVMGCLADWSWCDVTFAGNRGWAYAPNISYTYQGAPVPLYGYAPRLGIPIIVFSLGGYWDRYYRSRPWYSQRNSWMRRPPPPHLHPGRPPYGARPPAHAHGRPHGPPAHGPQGPGRGPGGRPGAGPQRPPPGGRPGPDGGRPDHGQRPPPGGRPGPDGGRPDRGQRPPRGGP